MSKKSLNRLQAKHRFAAVELGLLVLIGTAGGCNKSDLDKVIVEGTVTFAGAPIDNGEIRFYPSEGTVGPVSGAPISGGKYVAEAKGGVPVGMHQVQIKGFRRAENASVDEESNPVIPGGSTGAPFQYVPDQFNKKSELTIAIEGESNRVTKNFDLVP